MNKSRRTMLLGGAALVFGVASAKADTVTYTYDSLGRLLTAMYADGSIIAYTYDAAGNRSQVVQSLGPFFATIAITGTGPVNLRTLANSAGYNGAVDATVTFTLASGVTISGASGGGRGIDTGTWPTGSYAISLTLQITGNVYGGGGIGGAGQVLSPSNGGSGGDAIYCQAPISITVNSGGQVKGGGGGAGGGGGWLQTGVTDRAGGGGGGGFPNGAGGAAGGSTYGTGSTAGVAGTTSGGGFGGDGDIPTAAHGGGDGGTGGGAATVGATGGTAAGATGGWIRVNPTNGGAAGYAIRKNGNTVPVTNNGTITGTAA